MNRKQKALTVIALVAFLVIGACHYGANPGFRLSERRSSPVWKELTYNQALHADERGRLEVELKALPGLCVTENASCKVKRQEIATALRAYIGRIQPDVDFCKRYAKAAEADEQKDIAKSIEEYEAQLRWAQQEMKKVER